MSRFTAKDDLLHDISGAGPHARESLLWTCPLPAEELLVFAYMWRDSGDRWGRVVFVGGPEMYEPEFVSFEEDLDLAGDDVDDCDVGGLRVRQPEPLKVAEIAFTAEGLDFELRFEGIHEPFSWHEGGDGCPAWVALDRYEQSMLVTGRVKLGDRDITVDSAGHRDHSWGARDWNELQHHKWMNATAGPGISLHVMLMDWRGDRTVHGYLNRDGVVSPVVQGHATADLDELMIHRTITGDFTDEAGRTMHLEGAFAAGWQVPIQHYVLNEIGMAGTIDGEPAVVHIEFGWVAAYIEGLTGQLATTGGSRA